jgi:citrate lyase subunit beta / citryl-CoA lyase
MDRLSRLRRSLLYVPGNMPAMLQNIPAFSADGVMIDLEDAVPLAAKAAGVQAIDSVFSDVNDVDGLRAETALVKTLGFTGKSLVNPRQIEVVHEVFRPKPEEIEHALEVMDAIKRAREMGTGVISLRGRMVDAPVVKRAARTLRTAVAFGMIEYDLSEELIRGQE